MTSPESVLPSDVSSALSEEAIHQAWYAQRTPMFLGGHEVDLLRGSIALFPALIAAFDAATHSIWLANYLTSEVGQTNEVMQALGRAAQRGVKVHLVVDGIGSGHVPAAYWAPLKAQGVKLEIYRPVGPRWQLMMDTAQWRRMHVKICVVDDTLAFVGGINLIDDLYDLDHGWSEHPRLDYAVKFTGPSVSPALHTVRALWTRACLGRDWRDDLAELLKEQGRLKHMQHLWQTARLRLPKAERQQLGMGIAANQPIQAAFVLRDNLLQRRTIERAAERAIRRARVSIDITTPYFYPGRGLRSALKLAAQRGVTVRLLLQGRPDYKLAALAARLLYQELQAHGIKIFEYQAALLHAKVICIDQTWASVGSSNLDPMSMVMNLEANLIVRDQVFANKLAVSLTEDFSKSQEIYANSPTHRFWHDGISRTLVAWVAKTYLRLAGIARRY